MIYDKIMFLFLCENEDLINFPYSFFGDSDKPISITEKQAEYILSFTNTNEYKAIKDIIAISKDICNSNTEKGNSP